MTFWRPLEPNLGNSIQDSCMKPCYDKVIDLQYYASICGANCGDAEPQNSSACFLSASKANVDAADDLGGLGEWSHPEWHQLLLHAPGRDHVQGPGHICALLLPPGQGGNAQITSSFTTLAFAVMVLHQDIPRSQSVVVAPG